MSRQLNGFVSKRSFDHNSHKNKVVPIYRQLAGLIQKVIEDEYSIGDYLLPEIQLAKKYDVNRHTIRSALDELVKQGIIVRQPGKGTMVVSSPIDYHISESTRFTSRLEELGYETTSRLISKSIEVAPAQVAEYLRLPTDAKVIRVRTLRSVAETKVCVIDHFLSADRFLKVKTRFGSGSLAKFMKAHYQVDFERTISLISATPSTPDLAQHLQLSSQIPMLCIKTLNCQLGNSEERIEFSISHTRSDCMQLQVGDVQQIKPKDDSIEPPEDKAKEVIL